MQLRHPLRRKFSEHAVTSGFPNWVFYTLASSGWSYGSDKSGRMWGAVSRQLFNQPSHVGQILNRNRKQWITKHQRISIAQYLSGILLFLRGNRRGRWGPAVHVGQPPLPPVCPVPPPPCPSQFLVYLFPVILGNKDGILDWYSKGV